jgi:predicted  nucleic acid-binding Zn-ribbon protein
MSKITEKQLETIVKQQDELTSILNNIGAIETQKHALLHRIADVNKDLEEYKQTLEDEYGKISIDLKTGEYTEIKEEEETDLKVAE